MSVSVYTLSSLNRLTVIFGIRVDLDLGWEGYMSRSQVEDHCQVCVPLYKNIKYGNYQSKIFVCMSVQ